MYRLLYPYTLLLVLLPLAVRCLPPLRKRRKALYFPALASAPAKPVRRFNTREKQFRRTGYLLLYAGWCMSVLALSCPVKDLPPLQETLHHRNILMARDISLSMSTKDWTDPESGNPVSRWDAVKRLSSDFIHARKGDRIADVVFAQEAYVLVPFTDDPEVIVFMQEKVHLGDAGPKTSIGNAISVASSHFAGDSITRKMMIIVTDGLDTGEGISPMQMAEMAAQDSIRIYTVALGSPEDGFGNSDHATLQKISELTGGRSFTASSLQELKEIYSEIDREEPVEYDIVKQQPPARLHIYPLILSMVLAAAGGMMILLKD